MSPHHSTYWTLSSQRAADSHSSLETKNGFQELNLHLFNSRWDNRHHYHLSSPSPPSSSPALQLINYHLFDNVLSRLTAIELLCYGWSDIRAYMFHLLVALSHSHAKGIVHMDVKPSNYIFDSKDLKGTLIDFGISRMPRPHRSPQVAVASPPPTTAAAKLKRLLKGERKQKKRHMQGKKSARPPYRIGTRGFRAPEIIFQSKKQCPSKNNNDIIHHLHSHHHTSYSLYFFCLCV